MVYYLGLGLEVRIMVLIVLSVEETGENHRPDKLYHILLYSLLYYQPLYVKVQKYICE